MKKLWFRAKTYGWGWYPVSWQGWAMLAAYVGLLFGAQVLFMSTLGTGQEGAAAVAFVAFVLAVTAGLVAVCRKTGEKPGWRWGQRKK